MGENRRYDPEHMRREAERDARERADMRLREELKDLLLQALTRGSDVMYGVQRAVGHALVRLKLLHPAIRFLDSQGEIVDRVIEVPVEVPSTEPFDPHELSTVQLLQLVRTRLWEDTRIDQAERVQLIALTTDITRRLGGLRS